MGTRTPTTPNACLIAILLIVRSASGVTFTFHYPPKPFVDPPSHRPPHTPPTHPTHPATAYTSSSRSTSTSPASSDAEEDDRQSRTTLQGGGGGGGGGDAPKTTTECSDAGGGGGGGRRRSQKTEGEGGEEEGKEGEPPWESILGFRAEFLAGLLAPKASMCKTKFEMTVDDVVFLGFPLHVRPDGTWRKRKKRRRGGGGGDDDDDDDAGGGGGGGEEGGGRGAGEEEGQEEEIRVEEEADEEKGSEEHDGSVQGGMTMFHVVFVLNPPELEHHFRTQEIFDYVVKRFARALKYEQAKDGYVWREAVKINALREKAVQEGMFCIPFHELWKQILEQSSLAYAISRIYTEISQSRIAHVFLNNNLGLSLQIPIVTETSVLPGLADPQVPGLPLTTANSFGDEESEGDNMLARHFTLLFLADVECILKEIAAESAENNSLACFVKACKPTQSFLQTSNTSGLPLHDIQLMARHLIHWRKARAIPPIHQRDIYIVSPNADMRRLHTLIPTYSRLFPTLPTLPVILSKLSGKPKPYSTFIPSRDHRGAYLDILAWLLRHGLVTQLRNFAWLRVTREIKLRVAREAGAGAGVGVGVDAEDPAYEESVILAPHQASAVESAWIEMMMRGQTSDVKALFDRMMKYLNGQHAIEKIAVREGIARRDVRRVLTVMEEWVVYVSL